MNRLEPLKNLNKLGKGIDKDGPLKSELKFELLCDYLQKINYSIQDFNELIEKGLPLKSRSDIVYLFVLTDWIADSVFRFKQCYKQEVLDSFRFSQQEQLKECHRFLKALRSFVYAHPLNTSNHPDYNLDGDLICIDIRTWSALQNLHKDKPYRLSISGMEEVDGLTDSDIILYAYSKNEDARFFKYIAVNPSELRYAAALYIDMLYEFDKYLSSLKDENF